MIFYDFVLPNVTFNPQRKGLMIRLISRCRLDMAQPLYIQCDSPI